MERESLVRKIIDTPQTGFVDMTDQESWDVLNGDRYKHTLEDEGTLTLEQVQKARGEDVPPIRGIHHVATPLPIPKQ